MFDSSILLRTCGLFKLFFYGPIERLISLPFSFFSDDLTPIKRHAHWLKPIESISDGKTTWIRKDK